ncbi:ATP-dependent DNA helicase PIF1 [Tanacetum coccineum]
MWQYLVDAFTAVEDQRLKWTRNNQDTLHVDLYHNLCDAVTRGDTSAAGLGKRIVFPRSFIGNPRYMMQNYQDAMALCRAYGNPDLFITFTFNPKWAEISEMLAHVPGQKSHDRPEIGTQLEKCFKCMTPDEINDIISAEIPSPAEDPEGYKVFLAGTIIDEDGYPIYRRRDNKVTAIKGKFTYDNQHVVPYNRYLLLKYHAHINVECRWGISADFPVMQLNYHLPDQNAVTLRYSENLSALLEREALCVARTTETLEAKETEEKKCIGRIVYLSPDSGERYYLRMLLNVVRGPRYFEELMTVNKKIYATFKATCFAYGLLNDDKEWTHAIAEANRPLQLWEENWATLSEDILHKKEFQDIPRLNPGLLTNLENRLIRETLEFDVNKSKVEHEQLHSLLNPEQRLIYDKDYNRKIVISPKDCACCGILRYCQLSQRLKTGEDEPTWIEIPEEFLVKSWSTPIEQIVFQSYPDFTTKQTDESYLKERAILTPMNDDVDAINEYMFKKLGGVPVTYNSADEICKASTDTADKHYLYPIEFLNILNFPGMPPCPLLKKGTPRKAHTEYESNPGPMQRH